jgi:hypothetical protein
MDRECGFATQSLTAEIVTRNVMCSPKETSGLPHCPCTASKALNLHIYQDSVGKPLSCEENTSPYTANMCHVAEYAGLDFYFPRGDASGRIFMQLHLLSEKEKSWEEQSRQVFFFCAY